VYPEHLRVDDVGGVALLVHPALGLGQGVGEEVRRLDLLLAVGLLYVRCVHIVILRSHFSGPLLLGRHQLLHHVSGAKRGEAGSELFLPYSDGRLVASGQHQYLLLLVVGVLRHDLDAVLEAGGRVGNFHGGAALDIVEVHLAEGAGGGGGCLLVREVGALEDEEALVVGGGVEVTLLLEGAGVLCALEDLVLRSFNGFFGLDFAVSTGVGEVVPLAKHFAPLVLLGLVAHTHDPVPTIHSERDLELELLGSTLVNLGRDAGDSTSVNEAMAIRLAATVGRLEVREVVVVELQEAAEELGVVWFLHEAPALVADGDALGLFGAAELEGHGPHSLLDFTDGIEECFVLEVNIVDTNEVVVLLDLAAGLSLALGAVGSLYKAGDNDCVGAETFEGHEKGLLCFEHDIKLLASIGTSAFSLALHPGSFIHSRRGRGSDTAAASDIASTVLLRIVVSDSGLEDLCPAYHFFLGIAGNCVNAVRGVNVDRIVRGISDHRYSDAGGSVEINGARLLGCVLVLVVTKDFAFERPPSPLVGLLEVTHHGLADLATSVSRELFFTLEVRLLHPAFGLVPPSRGDVGGVSEGCEFIIGKSVRHV